MKRILTTMAILLFTQLAVAQQLLLECGQNSGNAFNGWFIGSHDLFDDITFDEHEVAFFSEYGGNLSVSLTRKLTAMKDYDLLHVLFNFSPSVNCDLEDVSYYLSKDGHHWETLQESRNNKAIAVANENHDYIFVKAVANATFYSNGTLACNYAKVEGEKEGEILPEDAPLSLKEITEEEPGFFIFNFAQNLNIETQREGQYELMITSIAGQIVYRETLTGSNRVELPGDMQGFYVVSVIQDNAFQASKKISL